MRSGYTLGGGGTRMGYGRLGAGVQDLGRWVVGVMWPWRLLRAPRGAGVPHTEVVSGVQGPVLGL